jgi:hypothetical protein
MRKSKPVRKIDLSKFKDETIEVTFSSTYSFNLSWLMDNGNYVKFDPEQRALYKYIIDQFSSSFFSDAFGRIPANSFTMKELKCNKEIEREFESQHSAFVKDDKIEQREKREKAKAEEKANRKSEIERLKKQLAKLENADKQDTLS